MPKKYPVPRKTMRVEYSLARYLLRVKIDDCLHDDVVAFLAKHDAGLDNLVNRLLNNHFASARYNDPSYPI
jgi:hypothetical protein